ncbi:MAG TPA: amino acid permease [Steroidobacteraceae bacterium]|jgi:APA family basic amino acid/polyamine antiporter
MNGSGWRSLFDRRPLELLQRELEADARRPLLRRVIGPIDLMLMGIGVIVGAGIFVVTGTAAALYAGPAITLSFLLAGLACALSAMCYAELAAMIPAAGSAYTYAYATLGELVAWVVGWNLVLEYVFAASYVAVGWSGYFGSFLQHWGLTLPPALARAPLSSVNGQLVWAAGVNLPAIAIVLFMAAIALRGIALSRTVNVIIVALKLAALSLVIVLGAAHINPHLWHPFIPPAVDGGALGGGSFGWGGVLRGAGVIFVAYLGFDAIATTAQETRNPQRSLPIAIIGALCIATLLYIVVSLVLTGLVPYQTLNVPDPLSTALRSTGPSLAWLVTVVDAAAVIGLASVILVALLAQSRILFAMSRDGLLPALLGRIHPRTRVPHWSTTLSAIVIAVLAGCFPIGILVQLVSIGTLGIFIVVCLAVIILRRTAPDRPRAFRAPWVPVLPVLGVIVCAYILLGLPSRVWHLYGAWILGGLLIYTFYGHRGARAPRPKAAHDLVV